MSLTRLLRNGVLGRGRAFTLMLPTFIGAPRIQLVAKLDPLGRTPGLWTDIRQTRA